MADDISLRHSEFHVALRQNRGGPSEESQTTVPGPGDIEKAQYPKGRGEWEAMRPVIKELYIEKNLPLRNVVEIMKTQYQFRATERMYKDRIQRWGWKTYNRGFGSSRPCRGPPNRRRPAHVNQTITTVSHVPSSRDTVTLSRASRMLIHGNSYSFYLDIAGRAYRDYILSWAETDPRWRLTSKYDSLEKTAPQFQVDHSLNLARQNFLDGDAIQGGRFLRLAFLELDKAVQDSHLFTLYELILEDSATICLMPQQVAHGVIKSFSRYIYQLMLIYRGNHPMLHIARALLQAANQGTAGVLYFLENLAFLIYDTLYKLRGLDYTTFSAVALHARTVGNVKLTKSFIIPKSAEMARQATLDQGEGCIDSIRFEFNAVCHIAEAKAFDEYPSFLPRCERLIAISRRWRYHDNRDTDPYIYNLHNVWHRLSALTMAKYYTWKCERAKVVEWCDEAVFLDTDVDAVWKRIAVGAEDTLKENGFHDAAEALAARRHQLEISPEVREALEKEQLGGSPAPQENDFEEFDDEESS